MIATEEGSSVEVTEGDVELDVHAPTERTATSHKVDTDLKSLTPYRDINNWDSCNFCVHP